VADAASIEAEVVDAPEAGRYELRLEGRVIGVAAYRRRGRRIVFTHTEIDESFEGSGLGSRLAGAALEDARKKALVVVPLCPFVAHYIERHPEYQQLLVARASTP
jgi:predicted GNAT family acetyltransferase